ncbi:MAG: hypothetical protein ACH37H_13230, partial [Ilumatobacteraceae bacterium]
MRRSSGTHHLADGAVVLLAAVLAVGIWHGFWVAAFGVVVALLARQPALVLGLCLVAAALGSWSGVRAWQQVVPRQL